MKGSFINDFRDCRWFTRGWCLQELLAPKDVTFFSREWKEIGKRSVFANIISKITSVHEEALTGNVERIRSYSAAQKFSWASKRSTTRIEDTAYCLMGLFNVHMPLLYGEGTQAFLRLQEEIMRRSDDDSIFAWYSREEDPQLCGLLAPSPASFEWCMDTVSSRDWRSSEPYESTNAGLRIRTALLKGDDDDPSKLFLVLQSYAEHAPERIVGIPLMQLSHEGDQYARMPRGPRFFDGRACNFLPRRTIFVRNKIIFPEAHTLESFGKIRSFFVSFETPAFRIQNAWPRGQWDASSSMILPPRGPHALSYDQYTLERRDLPDPALFNWSWHVALLIHAHISDGHLAQLIIVIGYNGRDGRCWCTIRKGTDEDLEEAWITTPYSAHISDFYNCGLTDGGPFVTITLSSPMDGGRGVISSWSDNPLRANLTLDYPK